MVSCEVCGERPAEVKARIENSVLSVCNSCAASGSIIAKMQPPIVHRAPQIAEQVTEEILVENYAQKIRDARSVAGLTQDEFALKLSVNSAVLKAAESGRRLDMPTARRIEKALKIKLIENI
jgi:uncharacterized protein (TIGR00270 family)